MLQGVILTNEMLAPEHYLMEIAAPEIAGLAVPGQFVHVRCGVGLDPFLRRPFSIHDLDPDRGTLRLLYMVKGRGTRWLASQPPGGLLNMVGPLGRGFRLPEATRSREVMVIGGGVGVAPLLPLVRLLVKEHYQIRVLMGAPTASRLLRAEAFRQEGAAVILVTEDGSSGNQGTAATMLSSLLDTANTGYLYACGPFGMLRVVAAIARDYQLPLQVSLDTYFACGVGACQGCACRVKNKVTGEETFARVCREGPVFTAEEVVWDV
jgi:dihydroorotate dehydrogenase electron transfer subunit